MAVVSMVMIASREFPNHDRNHNTGGNDLKQTQLVIAQQHVHMGGNHASAPMLPCMAIGRTPDADPPTTPA